MAIQTGTIITMEQISRHFNSGDWRHDDRERERLRWMIQCKMGYKTTTDCMFQCLLAMYESLY